MALREALEILGTTLAVGTLAAGVYQYYIAQKWKRAEFAASQLELLTSDPDLELCCKLLDWAGRVSSVPEKYRAVTNEKTFMHDWQTMKEAMLPEEDSDRADWDWQHMMYRDIFDRYFGYLESINHYVSVKLISVRDVASLAYWLEQLDKPRFLPDEQQSLFRDFIARYHYEGVRELTRRFQAAGLTERRSDIACLESPRRPVARSSATI
jgi:hypothetical protein